MIKESKTRLHILDTIRGIALISMILFHTSWDLSYIYGIEILQKLDYFAFIWQQSICIAFIFLSGFCFNLGKRHFLRGVTVFSAGALITAVTYFVMPENIILFGILTMLGSAMLIFALLRKILIKFNPLISFAVSLLLYLLTRDISDGYLGFYGVKIAPLSASLYSNGFTAFLGFPERTFFSADYFPLLPWLFLFSAGFFLFLYLKKKNIAVKSGSNIPVINFLGRNSLIVYLLHQPIIYGVLFLIFLKQ